MDPRHSSSNHSTHTHKASPTALLSSAKVVAEAAQSALHHDAHGYDKAKAAEAAAELLCAGSHYAKLDEGRYGGYVEKAENYLHQYGHKPAHTTTSAHGSGGGGGYGDYMKMAQGFMGHNSGASTGGHEGGEEGGYGEYVKMAQEFLKKH